MAVEPLFIKNVTACKIIIQTNLQPWFVYTTVILNFKVLYMKQLRIERLNPKWYHKNEPAPDSPQSNFLHYLSLNQVH